MKTSQLATWRPRYAHLSCKVAPPLMNVTGPYWWEVSFGSGNGAWCHQATSHYLSKCWPRSMSPYGVTRPQWVKGLQNANMFWTDFESRTHTGLPEVSCSVWEQIIPCWKCKMTCTQPIALASHLCTCVLHRQLCYLHTLKLPKFFNFHRDFHQKWYFAHPEFSFAHPELPFLAKSMTQP